MNIVAERQRRQRELVTMMREACRDAESYEEFEELTLEMILPGMDLEVMQEEWQSQASQSLQSYYRNFRGE